MQPAQPRAQPEGAPLSPAQTREIVQADRQHARFVFAAKVATFSACTLAAAAAVCVPFAVWSPSSLLVAGPLALAAYVELKGSARLRALDPSGARLLARNQIAVLLGIYVYCAANLVATSSGPPLSEQLQQDPTLAAVLEAGGDPMLDEVVGDMVANIDDLARTVTLVVYGAVVAVGTLVQGSMALFYVRRRRSLIDYLATTPAWILELQRQRR